MGPIRAIYENGVFKPTGPVSLPEGAEVDIAPRPVAPPPEPDEDSDPNILEREIAWLTSRTDADREETRRRLSALAPPVRPIPEGQTLEDMIAGTWPGDETDEQIREALERLS